MVEVKLARRMPGQKTRRLIFGSVLRDPGLDRKQADHHQPYHQSGDDALHSSAGGDATRLTCLDACVQKRAF